MSLTAEPLEPDDITAARPSSYGIKARRVTVPYRNGVTALTDASFDVPTHTITALVGVNGSGKSTLFKAIMGFLPLDGGEISILGQSVRGALKKGRVA